MPRRRVGPGGVGQALGREALQAADGRQRQVLKQLRLGVAQLGKGPGRVGQALGGRGGEAERWQAADWERIVCQLRCYLVA